MPATYEPIATTTIGTAVNFVDFTNISQNYTDLILVINAVASAGNTSQLRFNSDSGSNYSFTQIYGDGTSAQSNRGTVQTELSIGYPNSGAWTTTIVQINNYSNTTTNKSVLSRHSGSNNFVVALVGLWRSTAAISSIRAQLAGGATWATNSVLTIYGIKAA